MALSEEGDELVEHLKKTGLSDKEAKSLVFIAEKGETMSEDIEFALGISQPPVSKALIRMVEKGWLEVKRGEKKEYGRGRPPKVYSLSRPLDDIIEDVIQEEEQKIDDLEKAIQQLQSLLENTA